MDERATPGRTWAVVVAVEDYACVPGWSMRGPVRDAARFVAWLRRAGVPDHQIIKLASPFRGGSGAGSLGLLDGPATYAAADEVLNRRLPEADGDLLWFFWAGHGVEARDAAQLLFFSDADLVTGRHLDLDALLTSYRTGFVGFSRQIYVVDACRTRAQGSMAAGWQPLPHTATQARLGWDQTLLLGARSGEAAHQDPDRGGRFSSALMDVLEEGEGEQEWPPALRPAFQAVLERMKAEESGGQPQRPWWLRFRDVSGGEENISGGHPVPQPPAPPPPGDLPQAPAPAGALVPAPEQWRLFAEATLRSFAAAVPDDWLVTRRADLEVEIRGLDDARRLARAVHRGRPYSRPVTRLSAALAGAGRRWEGGDDHRVVLLEGGPGAGKSTALRDRVRDSLEEAVRRPGAELVIPVYVDLRDFRPGGPVTAAAIRAHIMACMSGGGDGRLASFVRTWFDHGLDAGWWWFLFDSFDELPALLTARNPARTAEDYASAITAFLYDLTPCRAVIATRDAADCATFRSLPQLRILPMSTQVQRQLIEHIAVSRGRRLRISGWLATAPAPIQEMAENPLLLSLLCHTITRHAETWVPGDRYEVLDGFVRDRLSPDERRAEWVGDFAAEIAMAMTRDAGPGLNPSVAELRAALAPPGGGGPPPEAAVLQVLDELKEAKLGRYTTTATRPAQRRFAFAHRSVQEYFVTRALLAQPDRVPPRELLSEPRWQGAAVSLLRTGPAANVAALVAEARRILDSDPSDPSGPSGPGEEDRMGADRPVLAVLAGGFAPPEPAELPADIRDRVGRSLLRMWAKGSGSERIEAVRFVPAADPGTAVKVLKLAFGHSSAFYRDEAYRRTVSMPRIPDTLLHEVRRSLVTLWVDGRLWRDAAIVEAQMRGGSLLGAVRLLRFGWLADLALCLAVMPVWFLLTDEEQDVQMLVIGGGLFGLFWHLGYHHVLRQAAWPGAEGPWHRRVWRFLRHTALFPGQVSDFASSFRRMLCGVSALGAILLLPIDYFTGAPAGTVLGLLALSVIALLVCVWPSGVREAVLHGRTGADLGEWLLLPLRPFPQRFRRAGRRLRSPARWWPDWLRPRALSRYYSGRYKWWKIAGTVAAVLAGGGYSVFEDPIDALLRENPLLRRLVATAAFVILAPLYLYGVVRITRPLLRARRDRKAVDAFRADAQRADPEVLGLPAFLEILAALRTTDGLHRLVSGLSAEPQEELADATLLPVGAEVMELLSWIAAARERFDALESASPGEDAPLTLDGWREEWEALLTDDGDLEVLALADRESLDLIAALQLTWSARTA